MVFTHHHRSAEAWGTLGHAMISAGFRVLDVFPVRSEGQSGFHSYGGSIKWDSVMGLPPRPDAAVPGDDRPGDFGRGLFSSGHGRGVGRQARPRRAEEGFIRRAGRRRGFPERLRRPSG